MENMDPPYEEYYILLCNVDLILADSKPYLSGYGGCNIEHVKFSSYH